MNPKLVASAIAAVLFFIIGSPFVYGLVNSILGGVVSIVNFNGVPTLAGLLLHSIVYGLATYGIMLLKKPKY